jgi:hypothetical protein
MLRGVIGFVGLAVFTAGALSATVLPYNYKTTGGIVGSPPNIVFNPQSTPIIGSTDAIGNAPGLLLGSFTLSKPGPHTITTYNNVFTLNVAFATPLVSGATTFGGLLSGALYQGTGESDVDLMFSPSSKVVTFTSPNSGSFTLTVHDILNMSHSEGKPATYNLTGDITNVQGALNLDPVPEPSSVFLLLTAIATVGLALRCKIFCARK